VSAASDNEIRELDASLAADGLWIELQRLIGTQLIPIRCTCRAFVRGYAASEVTSIIAFTDSKVIISPTQIIRAGWPGPNNSATSTKQDRRVPGPPNNTTDRFVINGKPRTIASSLPIYLDGELIRIDMRVAG
jgi:hypothetical protein